MIRSIAFPFFAAVAFSCGASTGAAAARPNIVLIMADDMGFSDLGCYGSEIATPNLDRLAGESLRFTRFYNTGKCCPTRASLLTGLYSHQAGIGNMDEDRGFPAYRGFLNERCATIAELLRESGYRTYMAGKWHVGTERGHWPLDRGFERLYGSPTAPGDHFHLAPGRTLLRDNEKIQPPAEWYAGDAFADHAIEYLRDHKAQSKEKPFFLYLAFTEPHWPIQAPAEDITKYKGKYLVGWDAVREQRYQKQIGLGIIDPKWALSPRDESAKEWKAVPVEKREEFDLRMATYAGMVDRLDRNVGRVLAGLKELGLEENTLVIFLSDNGGSAEKIDKGKPDAPIGSPDSYTSYRPPWANVSNTPFRRFKSWEHEGGNSTPLIVRWPGVVAEKGKLTGQVGHVIDLMPTCLEAAGIEYPKAFRGHDLTPVEGKSLGPILRGETRAPHETLFWEHEGNRAVRAGNWKLVAGDKAPWELYDLEKDRTETHDLAAAMPEKVEELKKLYQAWAARCGVLPWPPGRAKKAGGE